MNTIIEKVGVKYIEKNGLLYPDFRLEDEKQQDNGKYGQMWIKYLKEEYPRRYQCLMRFGELNSKALQVNETAYELLEDIEEAYMNDLKTKVGSSFMEQWKLRTETRMMAEEIVLHDVVYQFH